MTTRAGSVNRNGDKAEAKLGAALTHMNEASENRSDKCLEEEALHPKGGIPQERSVHKAKVLYVSVRVVTLSHPPTVRIQPISRFYGQTI